MVAESNISIEKHDKDVYYGQIEVSRAAVSPGQWTLRQKVALGCRIMAADGQGGGIAGQVTARLEDFTYWTQSFGLGFEEATASNQIRINPNLQVVEGDGKPNPGNRFHSYIYQRRPDALAIVHTHAPNAMALSMIGVPLMPACMETVAIWNDVAYLETWPGVPVGDEEGVIISKAIGDKRAILLAHHGMLTVGKTIEEATSLAVVVELAARLQLLAMAAGTMRPLPEREAREASGLTSTAGYYQRRFQYFARRVLAADTSCLD
jgi:L-fuculose-phosphate aldolase